MVLDGHVKQCNKCDFYFWGGGGGWGVVMFLVIGQTNGPLQQKNQKIKKSKSKDAPTSYN